MSENRKPRTADVLKMVIFLGIGFLFIYWFLIQLEPSQKAAIADAFRHADYMWVGVAMLCSIASHWLRTLRWRLLFEPIGLRPSRGNVFGSVLVAYLGNLAFPRAGEVMRCATLRTSEGIAIERSAGTVVTERIIDLVAFGIVLLIGLLAMFDQVKEWVYNTLSARFSTLPNIWVIGAIGVGVGLALLVLYRLCWQRLLRYKIVQTINTLVLGLIEGVKSIFHLGTRNTILFVIYSVAIYLLYILAGYIIFRSMTETASLGMGAAFVVYLFGTVGMTFSQGGIGVYPVLIQLALALYGISVETGTAIGWLLWGSQQAVVVVMGGAYLVYFSIKKKRNKQS